MSHTPGETTIQGSGGNTIAASENLTIADNSPGQEHTTQPYLYAAPAMLAILFFTIFIHTLPTTFMGFHIWGSDTGEYYSIIRSMIDSHQVPEDYQGWGFAYPYFYGMEALAATIALISGINAFHVMVFILPAISAFLVLLIFFITRKLLPDIRVALVGSLFVAVSPAGVFATSHPMPGALGDLLALLVLFFYLQLDFQETKFYL